MSEIRLIFSGGVLAPVEMILLFFCFDGAGAEFHIREEMLKHFPARVCPSPGRGTGCPVTLRGHRKSFLPRALLFRNIAKRVTLTVYLEFDRAPNETGRCVCLLLPLTGSVAS